MPPSATLCFPHGVRLEVYKRGNSGTTHSTSYVEIPGWEWGAADAVSFEMMVSFGPFSAATDASVTPSSALLTRSKLANTKPRTPNRPN